MKKLLSAKVQDAIRSMREVWPKLQGKNPFVAFSTGKDSLAMAAMLYEAVEPDRPMCLYAHHGLEFPGNLDYLAELQARGFVVENVRPFLEYFELMERGIGFLTLKDPWCVPMLVGTALIEWLQRQGARSTREGAMFRGMSRSEHYHDLHSELELYKRLDLPCFNPLLTFTKEEIIEVVQSRYGLPLNPIYDYMARTYCICCYTPDKRRQAYSSQYYPEVCQRYYGQIEKMLFDSGLMNQGHLDPQYRTREEKLERHGFIHWHRAKAQDTIGAVKCQLPSGALSYRIREADWIATKHLQPVNGKWARKGSEIRFWDVPERKADILIKRMMNCLDCGFCAVECLPCRRFDRPTKTLQIDSCLQCGKCIRLKFCMGWQHRFWRRTITGNI